MPTDAEIKARFWKALKSDRTLMLGLDGVEDGHARPMTAQFENDRSPMWFFASTDNVLVKSLPSGERAIATFASKGHDLFATLHGRLSLDNDRATIYTPIGQAIAHLTLPADGSYTSINRAA